MYAKVFHFAACLLSAGSLVHVVDGLSCTDVADGSCKLRDVQKDDVLIQLHRHRRVDNKMNASSCCGGCKGQGYCSSVSGNCYASKAKNYYEKCSGGSDGLPMCCSSCSGKRYCSPESGSCYDSKAKDYYEKCFGEGDGSTTDPAQPETTGPQCCTDCAGKLGFFSSSSGNCYKSKAKDYYQACPAVDSNVQKGECKVGGDNWCAATVPDANFSVKNCPGLGMRIKAITYNLFWWNLFGQRGGNHGSAGKLVKRAAGDEPFDLAGFQECDDPNWIMGDAGMSGDDYDYVRWSSNTLAFNKNRFELLESGDGKFAQDYGTYNYQRGAQWARLQEKSTKNKLFVMNHHGPLPVSTGGVCGGEATAYGALNMIDQHSEPGDAVLFMGDFNADGGSQTVKTLKGYMHHVMDDWVDNFFSNCGGDVVKETKNLGKGGSDHNALMVVMEF